MNQSVAKSILFTVEFDQLGHPTAATEKAFSDCLHSAGLWRAQVTLVHVKRFSDRVTWNPEYDNSPKQKRARRIDHALSGMLAQAQQRGIEAYPRVLFGDLETLLAQERKNERFDLIWSDHAGAAVAELIS